jgi:hypothetical protein
MPFIYFGKRAYKMTKKDEGRKERKKVKKKGRKKRICIKNRNERLKGEEMDMKKLSNGERGTKEIRDNSY